MNIQESIYKKIPEEYRDKVKAAKTPEELLAFAKEAGLEVSLDQLKHVCGGEVQCCNEGSSCPDYDFCWDW